MEKSSGLQADCNVACHVSKRIGSEMGLNLSPYLWDTHRRASKRNGVGTDGILLHGRIYHSCSAGTERPEGIQLPSMPQLMIRFGLMRNIAESKLPMSSSLLLIKISASPRISIPRAVHGLTETRSSTRIATRGLR